MTTNCFPTDSRDVIGSLEKVIPSIQTTVDDPEKHKTESLGPVNKHKVVISPLRFFPSEMLAEIFIQFVESGYCQDVIPPLIFMRICSRWRRIVLNTPRLWTKILAAHPMIDWWISRSGVLPLHVDLDFSHPASYPALEALILHSDRWEHVRFDLPTSSIAILDRVKSRLHSLKSLDVLFTGEDAIGTIDFCEVAPRLTEITLGSTFEPVIIKLPWEQLTVCTFDNTEIAHYVLQHAKNFRVLCLDLGYKALGPFTLMQGSPRACHLGLDTLIVKINFDHELEPVTVDHVNSFFRSITFPSLQTLELSFTYDRPGGGIQFDIVEGDQVELASSLAGFFERSCTRLSELKLIDIPFSQSALIECLVFSPSLVSLCIQFDRRWNAIGDELLHRLDVNRPMHILPRLRSLSLRQPGGTLIEESLDALITSRRHLDLKHGGVALLEDLTLAGSFPWFESGPSNPLSIHIRRSQNYIHRKRYDYQSLSFCIPSLSCRFLGLTYGSEKLRFSDISS